MLLDLLELGRKFVLGMLVLEVLLVGLRIRHQGLHQLEKSLRTRNQKIRKTRYFPSKPKTMLFNKNIDNFFG
jgi:hypothetical protein